MIAFLGPCFQRGLLAVFIFSSLKYPGLSLSPFPGITKHICNKTTKELAVPLSQPAEPKLGPKHH